MLFVLINKKVAAAGETVSTLRSYKFTFDAERHVKFMILKHNDLNNPHQLKFNSTINSEWVNDKWKTVVFVHGWIGGHRLSEIMKNGTLKFLAYNLIPAV